MTVTCSQCYRAFASYNSLHSHCSAKNDHPYCEWCQRLFRTHKVLEQHLATATVHQNDYYSDDEAYCDFCDRSFAHEDALEQHLNTASVHQADYYGQEDDYDNDVSERYCDYDDEEDEEYDEEDEADETYCDSCDRVFIHKEALYQHLSASSLHNWCFVCSRDFRSPHALYQHNTSRVHKAPDIKCPLCSRMFKSPSDIAGHIEGGGCNSHIDRHDVTAAVHALNITPTISINRRIAGPASNVTSTYAATELAYNEHTGKYECYLCHRQFRDLSRLNTHLVSPAHDATQFKCPHRTCGRRFTVISALIRHIESEACGLAKFSVVEDYTHELTNQFSRMLTL